MKQTVFKSTWVLVQYLWLVNLHLKFYPAQEIKVNKDLLNGYSNKLWIRPYFWGGYLTGGAMKYGVTHSQTNKTPPRIPSQYETNLPAPVLFRCYVSFLAGKMENGTVEDVCPSHWPWEFSSQPCSFTRVNPRLRTSRWLDSLPGNQSDFSTPRNFWDQHAGQRIPNCFWWDL